MAWKVDFRNNCNTFSCSIFYYFTNLFLGIPHSFAVRSAVVFLAAADVAYNSLFSDRTYFCKLRVFLYLDSPALVLGKVPVECIDLVQLQNIKISLYLFCSEEMSSLVEMSSSVAETWFIIYDAAWHVPVCICGL